MVPLQLELEGFLSYKDKVSINFEELTFFSITGKNGAGKTSLIEAIIFALFGETPRFNIKNRDKYINVSSNRAYVKFEFFSKGKTYTVERLLSKNKKNSTAQEVRLFENGKLKELKNNDINAYIEKVLGLGFETFTKTIILPQGNYTDFVKSSQVRRDIIKKLCNIEIFEKIRERAKYKRDICKNELNTIQKELEYLESLDENSIKQIEKKIEELKKEKEQLYKEKEKLLEEKQKQERFLEIKKEIEYLKEIKKQLEEKQEYYKLLEDKLYKLKEVEKKYLVLQALKDIEHIEKDIKEKKLQKEELENKIKKLDEYYKTIEKEIDALNISLEKEQEINNKIEYLNDLKIKVSLLEQDKNKEKQIEEKLSSMEKYIKNLEIEIEEKKKKLKEVEEDISKEENALKEKTVDESYALEVKSSFNEFQNLNKEKTKLLETKKSFELKLDLLLRNKYTLEIEINKLKEDAIAFHAHILKSFLKEGDICPVCNNKYIPFEETSKISLNKVEISSKLEELSSLNSQIEFLNSKLREINEKLSEIENKIKELNKKYGNLEDLNKEIEIKFQEKKQLENNINKIKDIKTSIEKELFSKIKEIELKKEQKKELTEELFKTKEKINEEFTKIEEKYHDYIKKDIKNFLIKLENKIKDLNNELKEKRHKKEKLEKDKSNILISKNRLEITLENMIKQISDDEAKLNELISLEKEIIERLKVEKKELYELIEEIQNLEQYEEEVKAYKKEKENIENKIKEKEKDLEKFTITSDYENLKNNIFEKEKKIEEIDRTVGYLEGDLKIKKENLEHKKNLIKTFEELAKKRDIYEIIYKDMANDKIQDFTVSLFLEEIVKYANLYIEKMGNKFSYYLESSNIIAIDNNTGEEKYIESLSGGESFISALAFILGISEALKGNYDIDFVFIDEGFGSLDKESLEIVGDIFESLSSELNKKVGIITHIESLAEKFPQRIKIYKDGKSSKIQLIEQ